MEDLDRKEIEPDHAKDDVDVEAHKKRGGDVQENEGDDFEAHKKHGGH